MTPEWRERIRKFRAKKRALDRAKEYIVVTDMYGVPHTEIGRLFHVGGSEWAFEGDNRDFKGYKLSFKTRQEAHKWLKKTSAWRRLKGKANPAPALKVGDSVRVYYPLTGKTFTAKVKSEPEEREGMFRILILDANGDPGRAVWSGTGWIYGDFERNLTRDDCLIWHQKTTAWKKPISELKPMERLKMRIKGEIPWTRNPAKVLMVCPRCGHKVWIRTPWTTFICFNCNYIIDKTSYRPYRKQVNPRGWECGICHHLNKLKAPYCSECGEKKGRTTDDIDKESASRYFPNPREVVVSDIDDTIIDSRDRELNACRNSKTTLEWWAIYNNPANFELDYPINSMWELLRQYHKEGKEIIYLSYRPEGLRKVTQQQLTDFEFPPGELILCPTDDYLHKSPVDYKLEELGILKRRGMKIIRVLEDNPEILAALNNAGYTTIAPGNVPMQPNPKRMRENSTKMQKLLVQAHPLQKLAAEWKDNRGWKDLNKAEAIDFLKTQKAVISLKMDGELECVAVDLKKGFKVGNRRYKCVIANKTTMSRKKEGGVWREVMRTGKVRTGGPICDEMIALCRRGHIRRFIGFGELYGHKNGKRVPFGDTAHYISSTSPKLWKRHVRLALFDIYAINGKKVLSSKPYVKVMKLLRKKFSGVYVQTALFKYGTAKTFKKVWRRWIETQGNEGLVITIGRMAYKVKPSLSVDGVIIALKKTGIRWAEKRLASAFKTAVMNKKGEFVEIADVGNGFSDIERAKLTKLILKNKIREDKDYIYCKPITVIEVAGMEKTKSRMPTIQVYDKRLRPIKKQTGWSIRMPKFIRYRKDKVPVYKDIRSEQLYAGGESSWSEQRII